MLEDELLEPIYELILDAADETARVAIGYLFNYLISKIKTIEADQLAGNNFEETVTSRWVELLCSQLFDKAAKQWRNLKQYLEIFQAFALYTPNQVIGSLDN